MFTFFKRSSAFVLDRIVNAAAIRGKLDIVITDFRFNFTIAGNSASHRIWLQFAYEMDKELIL